MGGLAGPYPEGPGSRGGGGVGVGGFAEEVGASWRTGAVSMFEAHRKQQLEEEQRREYEREKARQATIARSRQEAARRATGTQDGGGPFGPSAGAFAWKNANSGPRAVPSQRATSALSTSASTSNRPSHGACQEAVEAMMSRTVGGMKEGLAYLDLPTFPIDFAPGSHLKLCGHSVREEVNAMIHSWLTDDREAFYDYLAQVRAIVEKPLLTEEQVDLVGEGRERWVKVRTREGEILFARRGATPPGAAVMEDDDDDDEVLDVPSPPTQAPVSASKPLTAVPAPVASATSAAASRGPTIATATATATAAAGTALTPPAVVAAAAPAGQSPLAASVAPQPVAVAPASAAVAHAGAPAGAAAEAAAEAACQETSASGAADYYSLLGVNPTASLHEIRSKFRQLVLIHHPQKGGDKDYFNKLRKAYEVLSNVQERQRYDLTRTSQ